MSTAFGQLTAVPGISTVAGNGTTGYSGDGGAATSATINVNGLACDKAGNLYIADHVNNVVRKVSPAGVITTVAGTGQASYSGDGGPATAATLSGPYGIAVDSSGNLYIADSNNYSIRVVQASTGIISTYAGNGTDGNTGDGGLATNAKLALPVGLALDAKNNLYIATAEDNKVRMVTSSGQISTFAGTGVMGETGDGGLATQAKLNGVFSLAVDSLNNLYLSELNGIRIRKITAATGIITTFAGTGTAGYSGDGGPATSATLSQPMGIAIDSSDRLYISDQNDNVVRYVHGGIIDTFAGNGSPGYSGDGGPAIKAELSILGLTVSQGLAVDAAGNLYISDDANGIVRKVSAVSFPATAVASSSTAQNLYLQVTAAETISSITVPPSQGNKQEYTVGTVTGCAVDGTTTNAAGSICTVPITFKPAYPGLRQIPLHVAASDGNQTFGLGGMGLSPLAALTPGINTTFAGTGTPGYSGDGGPASSAQIGGPFPAVDSAGNIYFADSRYHVVRRIDALTGIITTVAGTGAPGYSGDGGPATSATFNSINAVAVDGAGNLYIGDAGAFVVRKVTAATGIITTVAGNGTQGTSGIGGLATSAQVTPDALAVDAFGDLYISSTGNNAGTTGQWVFKVNHSSGILSVVAGTGAAGYSGDGGPATAATLYLPAGLAFDSANNLYIADRINNVIRKVTAATGIITTVAGNGTYGYSGNGGPALNAEMEYPQGITLDSAGNIYFTDCCTDTVRKIDTATGIITTIAGGGTTVTEGGLATSEQYNVLYGVVLDGLGNLYIGDFGNARIHKINFSTTSLNYLTSTVVGQFDSTDNPRTAFLSNVGNQPLLPASGNGAISASWSIAASSTCAPLTSLPAGDTCTLPVNFKPTQVGSLTGTLSIADNSLNANPATQIVTLSGTAINAGSLSIAPTTQTFPATAVGSTSATLSSTISNSTASAIYLSAGSLTDASDFTQSDNCNGMVASASTCTVTFAFTPQNTGALTSTYSIHDLNTPNSPLTVALSGTVTGVGQASLTPASLNFGNVTQGSTAASQTLTLANAGTASVSITSIGLTGTNASSFSITSNTCGASLAAGSSCNIAVSFTPSAAVAQSASVTVVDSVGTQASSLSGVGVAAPSSDFTLTATPASQTSAPGSYVTYQIAVAPAVANNPFNNAVSLTVSGLPAGATAAFAPASVTPGAASASSILTVTISAQRSQNHGVPTNGRPIVPPFVFATLFLALGTTLNKRVRRQLSNAGMALVLVFACGLCITITGCGGTGFAVPQTTSTITVTGTSGTLIHSTTVTLTLK